MKKRLFVLIVSIVLIFGVIPTVTARGMDADTSWYNDTDASFIITTADELAGLSSLVNAGNDFSGKTITLGNSIDLNNEEWTAIGTYENPFNGIFDGCGYTISNLYINSSNDYQGLFGRVTSGTVRNVSVSGNVTGYKYVGGVVGLIASGVSTNSAVVSSSSGYGIGGVVGRNNGGTVTNCINRGTVTSTYTGHDYVGGVVGLNQGTVANCCNSGRVSGNMNVGGVVGYNPYTVTSCYNSGTVSGNTNVGGVVGNNYSNYYDIVGTVTNCYNLSTTESAAYGKNTGTLTSVENKTAAEFASGEVTWLLNSGTTDGTQAWYQNIDNGETVDSYPVLDCGHGTVYCTITCDNYSNIYSGPAIHVGYDADGFCTNCGGYQPATLNSDGRYEISNTGQLFWFASLVNGDTKQEGITAADTTASAVLLNDIAIPSGYEWIPIGTESEPYIGTFDGGGYEISGLNITSAADYVGLFGYVTGTVKDLTVFGEINVSGNTMCAGGIVGTVKNGTLSGLTSYVNVTGYDGEKGIFGGVAAKVEGDNGTSGSTVERCAYYGTVKASGVLDCVGGIAGYMNAATIINCINYGTVDTTGGTAAASAGIYTGGIVSYINNANAVVKNCVNVGTISVGHYGVSSYTGAIIGRINQNVQEVSNCYYLTDADSTLVGVAENGSSVTAATEAKTAEELASGEVTWLLTGGTTDGTQVWYQNIDIGAADSYPVLDSTHGTVYYGTNCKGSTVYRNTMFSANGHSLTHVEAKAACTADGNIEYWYCLECGMYFSDSSTTTEIGLSDTVISVTGHYYDTDGFCSNCGAYEPATLNTNGVYEISNAGQLFWFASLVNGDTTQEGITAAVPDASAVLTSNIDLSVTTSTHTSIEWTPIGSKRTPFSGTFDGGGCTVSGMSITTTSDYMGLFGYVTGTVKNMTVSGSINVSGSEMYAGGIVGTVYDGTLSGLTSTVTINGADDTMGTFGGIVATAEGTSGGGSTVERCTYSGSLTASGVLDCIGGIVGYINVATINDCLNSGTVDTTGGTSGKSVTTGIYTSGIVGYCNNTDAVITNCLNLGTISDAGSNTGVKCYTGAIIGRINSKIGSLSNCYYLSGTAGAGCGINGSRVDVDSNIAVKTADEFATGEVAWLLQGNRSTRVWGQDLTNQTVTTDDDLYPVFSDEWDLWVLQISFYYKVGNTVETDPFYIGYTNYAKALTSYPTEADATYKYYIYDGSSYTEISTSRSFGDNENVYVEAAYAVVQDLGSNLQSSNTDTTALRDSSYSTTLTGVDCYVLPDSITVTSGGTELTAGIDYTYDSMTGEVTISKVMGKIVITADATNISHNYDSGFVTTKPGCTDEGVMTYTCVVCGETRTEAISATGHTAGEAVKENVVAATCTTDGSYDSVVYCTVCGAELSRETITVPATGHSYVSDVTDPTCTEKGYTTYTCIVCGHSYTDNETEATGHSYTSVVKDPTCTEEGYTTHTCSVCGDTYVDSKTEATGHSWDEGVITTAATCTAEGVRTYTCIVCGETRTEAISATGHTAGETVVENEAAATCTADGSYDSVVYCTVCGEELSRETVTVPATGHTSGEAVKENEKEATCAENGSYDTVVYCTVCGAEISRETTVVPATGHSFGEWEEIASPTCEDHGSERHTCTVCGYVETRYVDATGHDWEDGFTVDQEPTCTTDGSRSIHCKNCDAVKDSETIPATGHTAGEAVIENKVEATCTENGSYDTVVYCKVCGDEMSRVTTTVPVLGHTAGEAVIENKVEATCTEAGSYDTVVYCTVCGEEVSRVTTTVPATGHDFDEVTYTWSSDGSTCTATRTCKTDNAHTEQVTATVTGAETKAATCTEAGETTYTAVFAEAWAKTQTKTIADIPALGHDFSGSFDAWDENGHWHICNRDGCTATDEPEAHSFTNYVYDEGTATWTSEGTETAICDADGCGHTHTRTADGSTLPDDTAPTGEITVGLNRFKDFINTITFGIFCRDKYDVTITAEDGKTGIASIEYLLSETEISETDITSAEGWQTYEGKFAIEDEGKYIIYAKITDNAGNIVYISTDGLVVDRTNPQVSGIEDDGIYCGAVEVSVYDEYLATVTIDGVEQTLTDGKFTVYPAEKAQTIIVTDRAGNSVSYTVTVWAEHTWDSGEVTKAATCTEAGEMTYTCTICGETKTETIPAMGHTAGEEMIENEVEATCTEEGSYDTVVYCTVCGEELSRETTTIPAKGHTAGEAVIENKVEATCTEEGSYDTVVYCTVCGEELSRETTTIPATGHTAGEAVIENEVEATCTEDGSYDIVTYCTMCGEELSREMATVSAVGHSYGEPVWNWNSDHTEAWAVFTCEHDASHTETVTATITVIENELEILYTATVTLDGQTWTDERTVAQEETTTEETTTEETTTLEETTVSEETTTPEETTAADETTVAEETTATPSNAEEETTATGGSSSVTGDISVGIWIMILFVSGTLVVCIFWFGKKREEA